MRYQVDFFDGPQRSQLRIVPVGPVIGGECYLIFADDATVLLDSGFHFCGPQLVENLRVALQGKTLDFILLTHSHYDHVLGSPYCKQAFPDAVVVAHDYAAKIFQKSSARTLMRELDAFQAAQYGYRDYPDKIDTLTVDRPVKDGDLLLMGRDTVQIIALPGHTRCCVGYYFQEKQILLAPETLGVPGDADVVVPAYLVGYQMTLDSIARAQQLPLRELLTPHAGMLYGEACQRYLARSAQCCQIGRDAILTAHGQGADLDELVEVFRQKFYPTSQPNLYPEKAFQTNVRVQIPLILRECGEVE